MVKVAGPQLFISCCSNFGAGREACAGIGTGEGVGEIVELIEIEV